MTVTHRLRQWFGCAATLLAAIATMATSYGSDYDHLKLPDQSVTLAPTATAYRSRFRVESDDGKFELRVQFMTTAEAVPVLELKAIGDNAVTYGYDRGNEAIQAELENGELVQVACPAAFPCVSDFEVSATADSANTVAIQGTLRIEASMYSGGSKPSGTYLAIERLP